MIQLHPLQDNEVRAQEDASFAPMSLPITYVVDLGRRCICVRVYGVGLAGIAHLRDHGAGHLLLDPVLDEGHDGWRGKEEEEWECVEEWEQRRSAHKRNDEEGLGLR